MRFRNARLALPVAAAAVGLLAVAPSAQATIVHCGDVITVSTKVDNDLVGCAGPNALVVQGTGVTLNLNSKEIIGSGADTGILVDPASSGVTITNGRVSAFATGVDIEAPSTSVTALGVDHNSTGVVTRKSGTSVKDSYFDRNGTGIQLGEAARPGTPLADDSTVQNNTIMRSTADGILVIQSLRVLITKNTVGQNGRGIRGNSAFNSVIDRNYVSDNDTDGIVAKLWDGAKFTNNQTLRNGGTGFLLVDSYVDVIGNTSSNNGRDGFSYFENGGLPSSTRFGDNKANDNGGWGFQLNVGTTDLGGNLAKRNALGGFNTVHP